MLRHAEEGWDGPAERQEAPCRDDRRDCRAPVAEVLRVQRAAAGADGKTRTDGGGIF